MRFEKCGSKMFVIDNLIKINHLDNFCFIGGTDLAAKVSFISLVIL